MSKKHSADIEVTTSHSSTIGTLAHAAPLPADLEAKKPKEAKNEFDLEALFAFEILKAQLSDYIKLFKDINNPSTHGKMDMITVDLSTSNTIFIKLWLHLKQRNRNLQGQAFNVFALKYSPGQADNEFLQFLKALAENQAAFQKGTTRFQLAVFFDNGEHDQHWTNFDILFENGRMFAFLFDSSNTPGSAAALHQMMQYFPSCQIYHFVPNEIRSEKSGVLETIVQTSHTDCMFMAIEFIHLLSKSNIFDPLRKNDSSFLRAKDLGHDEKATKFLVHYTPYERPAKLYNINFDEKMLTDIRVVPIQFILTHLPALYRAVQSSQIFNSLKPYHWTFVSEKGLSFGDYAAARGFVKTGFGDAKEIRQNATINYKTLGWFTRLLDLLHSSTPSMIAEILKNISDQQKYFLTSSPEERQQSIQAQKKCYSLPKVLYHLLDREIANRKYCLNTICDEDDDEEEAEDLRKDIIRCGTLKLLIKTFSKPEECIDELLRLINDQQLLDPTALIAACEPYIQWQPEAKPIGSTASTLSLELSPAATATTHRSGSSTAFATGLFAEARTSTIQLTAKSLSTAAKATELAVIADFTGESAESTDVHKASSDAEIECYDPSRVSPLVRFRYFIYGFALVDKSSVADQELTSTASKGL